MSKVQLSGNVSGTGIFTIASPNSNTDRTLTLPDSTGTLLNNAAQLSKLLMPSGSVLQVVQATKTTNQTIATATKTDLSGLSVTITPTASSSKFLLMVSIQIQANANNGGCTVWFVRNSTVLGTSIDYTIYPMSSGSQAIWTDQYLDSPATASAITYKCQAATPSAVSMGFNQNSGQARLTVLEIAG